MSTPAIINFKLNGEDYPLVTTTDGYIKGIIPSISQLKMFCTIELLQWEDLYNFIKKYAKCYHIEWFTKYDKDKFFNFIKNPSVEKIFVPFDNGYLDRNKFENDNWISNVYQIGYKIKTFKISNSSYKIHQMTKSQCMIEIIKYVFEDRNLPGVEL